MTTIDTRPDGERLDDVEERLEDIDFDNAPKKAPPKQLALFEGAKVTQIVTRFRGSDLDDVADKLKPYELVRYEGYGKVVDIRHTDDDGSLRRLQVIKPLSVEITGRDLDKADVPE